MRGRQQYRLRLRGFLREIARTAGIRQWRKLFAHLISDKAADCSAAYASRGATGSQDGACDTPYARRHCDGFTSQRHTLSGIQDEQQGYGRCAQHYFFQCVHL